MEYHEIPCNTMQYHAIPCNTMQYHAIQCNTMQYHAIPCNTMQYHGTLITADRAYHCPVGSIMAIFSSVRGSYSHPDLLVTQHHPHFFRSHRSSTLDFHFLSHYSYIKAIMLHKSNHWTRCAGFMDASWDRLGITNDDLGTSWSLTVDNLGILWQDSGILWHTLAHSGILWRTLS